MDPLREFFELLAPEWDASQPEGREEILHGLFFPFDELLLKSLTILDIGTGTGSIISVLKKRYLNSKIFSIDLAGAMLVRARRRLEKANLIQADAQDLPFGINSFSAAVCHNSFPHFQEKAEALHEIKRVLKPKGYLFILHDLGRNQVNLIHQKAKVEVIRHDLLPAGSELADLLLQTGFEPLFVEDIEDHYLVSARVL